MRILWSRPTPLSFLCSVEYRIDSTNNFVVISDSSRFFVAEVCG